MGHQAFMARDANGRQLGFHPGVSGFDPRTRYQWIVDGNGIPDPLKTGCLSVQVRDGPPWKVLGLAPQAVLNTVVP